MKKIDKIIGWIVFIQAFIGLGFTAGIELKNGTFPIFTIIYIPTIWWIFKHSMEDHE